MNEPETMGPNTESVYWAMLMELESLCKTNDLGMKDTIRAAYRHWNATHPDKKLLTPRFDEGLQKTQIPGLYTMRIENDSLDIKATD